MEGLKSYKCISFLRPTMWKSKRKNPVYQCSVFFPCPSIHSKSPVSAHVFLDTSLSSIATSRSLLWALCGLCCLMKSCSHSLIDIHNEIQPDVWPSPHMNLVYDQLITKHILQRDPKLCAKNSNCQVRAPQMSSACWQQNGTTKRKPWNVEEIYTLGVLCLTVLPLSITQILYPVWITSCAQAWSVELFCQDS